MSKNTIRSWLDAVYKLPGRWNPIKQLFQGTHRAIICGFSLRQNFKDNAPKMENDSTKLGTILLCSAIPSLSQ